MLENYTYLDLNMATQVNGYTPLSSACMAGNYEIVCLLAENGADVNQVDCSEQSPLIYCFSRLNEDENYYENKGLALKMADVLLNHGADINQYSMGRTILMTFCIQDFARMKKI
jgi:ankyrin repeat protein